MPPFLYTIIITTAIFWWTFVKIITSTKPDNFTNIIVFLIVSLISISLTLSLPIYVFKHKKSPKFTNLKKIYRKSLGIGFFVSLGITSIMTLKAFGLANPLNLILFTILYLSIFWQISKKL